MNIESPTWEACEKVFWEMCRAMESGDVVKRRRLGDQYDAMLAEWWKAEEAKADAAKKAVDRPEGGA